MRRLIPLTFMFLVSFAAVVYAAGPTANVSWTAPTTNVDGSAIPAGSLTYTLYQGATGSEAPAISNLTATTATVTAGLTAGATVCFKVVAIENGVQSAPSNEACSTIPKPVPGVPTQITVVIH